MKWLKLALAVAVLVIGFAPSARAQEERDEKECVCESRLGQVRIMPRGVAEWPQVFWVGRRARLGVWVNTEADPETDRIGARVDGVTEGGPADKAGIEEGDIITKLDGESLLTGGEDYDEEASAPGMRLIERARNLESGDTIEVEFVRDGETQTVELVTGEFDDVTVEAGVFGATERLRGLMESYRELPEVHVRAPESYALRLSARFPTLELVSLNPELGEYFGAEEGLLVVSVPEDTELNLRSGDVILSIDGRNVRSPSHAMRVLRSYDADEEVSFQIVRQKRSMTVEGKVPERLGAGNHFITIERN
jgi:S1-C subfamily serine protease